MSDLKELNDDKSAAICGCGSCTEDYQHASDCAVHNEPAVPAGDCDCACEVCGKAQAVVTVKFHDLADTMRYCAGTECRADLESDMVARLAVAEPVGGDRHE